MEGGCGVADQLAASAQPPCARGGARQPGSINRGVLHIRPGAPNGTKVGVRRGLGAPHRRRPARGCSWSAAPRLAGSSTPPEQEAAVEITARKSRGGALLHPHTLRRQVTRLDKVSAGCPPLRFSDQRASRFSAAETQNLPHGSCRHLWTANQQPCIPSLRLADAKSIGLFGR